MREIVKYQIKLGNYIFRGHIKKSELKNGNGNVLRKSDDLPKVHVRSQNNPLIFLCLFDDKMIVKCMKALFA